ncbi:MAG: peroxiredoxin family protein [Candidatus Thorarchaeota archaeon]
MDTVKGAIIGVVLVIVITGIVIGTSMASYSSGGSSNTHTTSLTLAPDVDLIDQKREVPSTWEFDMSDGSTMKIDDYSGYYLIVDLMGTSCPACESENSELQDIYDYHNDTIKIVSLCVDLSATTDAMATYKSDHNLPWAHGIDGGYFTQYFHLRYTPTLVIVDPDGYIRMYHEGLWKSSDIVESIALMK